MDIIVSAKSYIGAARNYVASIKWERILPHYVAIKRIAEERWKVNIIIADDQARATKSPDHKVFRIEADRSVERI